MQKKLKGFTIIELIVVVAIVAVLASIVMVNVSGYIKNAKTVSVQLEMKSFLTYATEYYSDPTQGNGSYFVMGDGGSAIGICNTQQYYDLQSRVAKINGTGGVHVIMWILVL